MSAISSLQNKTIITTQQADSALQLIKLLNNKGAEVFHIPMIETRTLLLNANEIVFLKDLHRFDLLVFTSKSGVRGFVENLDKLTGRAQIPEKLKIAAIGQGTADEVEKSGHRVTYMNPGKDVRDLAGFINLDVFKGGERVLLPLGSMASDYLEKELSKSANIVRINVYRTDSITPENNNFQNVRQCHQSDICIFSSPSGFLTYLKYYRHEITPRFAAIGATTANCIMREGYTVEVVAPYPSATAIVEALEEYFRVKKHAGSQS